MYNTVSIGRSTANYRCIRSTICRRSADKRSSAVTLATVVRLSTKFEWVIHSIKSSDCRPTIDRPIVCRRSPDSKPIAKLKKVAQRATIAHLRAIIHFFLHTKAANSVVSIQIWPKFKLVQASLHVLITFKYQKDQIKSNQEVLFFMETPFSPL